MRGLPVRIRLTIWYVAIMAAVLIGSGVTLSYSVQASLAAAADRDLADRLHLFSYQWARWDTQPLQTPGSEGMFGGGNPFGEEPSPSHSTGATETEAERRGFYRRPRLLDWNGRALIPLSDDQPWDEGAVPLALGGKERYTNVVVEHEPLRVLTGPLWRKGDIEGVIQVAYPLAEQQHLTRNLERRLITLIPIALLVAGVGGAFLTDRALCPVREISQAAAQIGAEDLSRRLDVRGNDELSELARTFNGMIGRLEDAFGRMEEAYEQQRRFTADASHELRTPLTAIKANTSLALSGEGSPELYQEALEAADEAADTMNRIVQDLVLLARSDGGHLNMPRVPIPVSLVLQRAVAAVRHRPGPEIVLDTPETPLGVMGDTHHLVRRFVNLLENAARHTPQDGRVILTARSVEGGMVEIRVIDTGEGIAPEHLPHLCDRFYRVDAARSRARGGSGLGLAICRSIAVAPEGCRSIESEVGAGTTVIVTLPAA